MKQKIDIKDAANFAVILGIILSLWSYVSFSFGLEQNMAFSALQWLIIFGALFYYVKSTRDKKYEGYLSFGRGLGLSVIVSAFSGFILGVFSYVYLTVIDPSKMETMLQMTYDQYIESGMSVDMAEQSMQMVEKFMNPMVMAFSSVFGMALWGLLLGLIVAAILKKNPPVFDDVVDAE